MAFMPEDVLNKNFTATQFRRGYDEQEVDDFLDEIVVELRRLSSDNDDLRVQLKACQESKGVTVGTGAAVSPAAVVSNPRYEAPSQDLKRDNAPEVAAAKKASEAQREAAAVAEREARDKIAAAKVSVEQAEKDAAARIAKAKSDAETAEAQAAERVKTAGQAKEAADKAAKTSFAVSAPAAASDDGHKAAAGVLALAQRLHEEYVAEGESTRERLISEGQEHHDRVVGESAVKQQELVSSGQAKHDELLTAGQAKHNALIAEASARHEQMITEARERSTGMVAEAQQKKTAVLQELSRERDLLQKKIDELRTFERDYRARLKSYLETQLLELGHTGVDDAAGEGGAGNKGQKDRGQNDGGQNDGGQQHDGRDSHRS